MKPRALYTEDRQRLLENTLSVLKDAAQLGLDPDELIEEAKRKEAERQRADALRTFRFTLARFQNAARDLARAWDNEHVDPMAISETYPEGWPTFEEVADQISEMRMEQE